MKRLFLMYSYLYNIMFSILNFCPPFLRKLMFRLLFRRLGKDSLIDYGTYFRYPSKIIIGDNVSIMIGTKFFPVNRVKNVEIIIEDNVRIGPNVTIIAGGHDYNNVNFPIVGETVKICRNVWIGGGSIILQGVTVGEWAVIGAGSVVTKDVPPYSVAVGVPARVIKKIDQKKHE